MEQQNGQGQAQVTMSEEPQAGPFSLMSYQTHVTELIELPVVAQSQVAKAQAFLDRAKQSGDEEMVEAATMRLEVYQKKAAGAVNPSIVEGLNALHSDVQKLGIVAIAFDGADTLTRQQEYRKAVECLSAWALANGIVKKLPSRGGGGTRNNGTRGGYVKVVDQSKLDTQSADTKAKVQGAITNGVHFDTAKLACTTLGVELPDGQSGSVYLKKAGLELTQDKPTA